MISHLKCRLFNCHYFAFCLTFYLSISSKLLTSLCCYRLVHFTSVPSLSLLLVNSMQQHYHYYYYYLYSFFYIHVLRTLHSTCRHVNISNIVAQSNLTTKQKYYVIEHHQSLKTVVQETGSPW